MELFDGGVTAPKGFRAAGICAGIKKDRKDMALLVCDVPCALAGTFTTNLVQASPVVWDRALVQQKKRAQAVVVNSGVANACTGAEGDAACEKTAQAAADALGLQPEQILLASTGVIGAQLPLEKMCAGIQTMTGLLSDSRGAAADAAQAIMTTDTQRKEAAVRFTLGGKQVTLAGMTKGAGMIHPQMGTMLCFLTTDAAISPELAQEALLSCVQNSFNMISIDGDQSTNDTCLLLASGLAGNGEITRQSAQEDPSDYETFCAALALLTKDLARRMAADGEGAHALFEVKVTGAATREDAVRMAKAVVGSSLVKTAVAGHDANWGRVFCAMGYSGAQFDPRTADLIFRSAAGSVQVARQGAAAEYSEVFATKVLSEREITAAIDLHQGQEEATAWGCDLTHEYISINADYRS